jgi:hypothetical protein
MLNLVPFGTVLVVLYPGGQEMGANARGHSMILEKRTQPNGVNGLLSVFEGKYRAGKVRFFGLNER